MGRYTSLNWFATKQNHRALTGATRKQLLHQAVLVFRRLAQRCLAVNAGGSACSRCAALSFAGIFPASPHHCRLIFVLSGCAPPLVRHHWTRAGGNRLW
jgi:hypothetical protein